MSKTPPGPNETRLRELREERAARNKVARKPIPYAGKERGGNEELYGHSAQRGVKKGPRK